MERCILRHKCLGIDKPKQNGAKRSSFSLFNRRPKIYLSADESGSSSKGSSRDDGDAGGGVNGEMEGGVECTWAQSIDSIGTKMDVGSSMLCFLPDNDDGGGGGSSSVKLHLIVQLSANESPQQLPVLIQGGNKASDVIYAEEPSTIEHYLLIRRQAKLAKFPNPNPITSLVLGSNGNTLLYATCFGTTLPLASSTVDLCRVVPDHFKRILSDVMVAESREEKMSNLKVLHKVSSFKQKKQSAEKVGWASSSGPRRDVIAAVAI